MNIRPVGDRILVRRKEWENKTAGGIVLPNSAKENQSCGVVLAVGKGKRRDNGEITPMDIKAQDEVLFGKYAGTEIEVEGETLIMMREEDVMGVYE